MSPSSLLALRNETFFRALFAFTLINSHSVHYSVGVTALSKASYLFIHTVNKIPAMSHQNKCFANILFFFIGSAKYAPSSLISV